MAESLTDKIRRRRREERRNWTLEDEREWLAAHPEDEPLEGFAQAAQPAPEDVQHDEDLVPDLGEDYERTEEDHEIDGVLARLGIVEAYNRWSRKGRIDQRRLKSEGTKVRCPNPQHPDHNPSAWLNTDKDVWVCGGCGMQGGDKFDIAAWYFGFDVPGYKRGKDFVELRKKMAVDLGYKITHSAMTGKTYATKSEDDEAPAGTAGASSAGITPQEHGATSIPSDHSHDQQGTGDNNTVATVTPLIPEDDETDPNEMPGIDWRSIVSDDTFMSRWMDITSNDDLPEEYYFFMGLMMVGMALGNDLVLKDRPPVKGNMFLVLLGPSGIGKSRSINAMNTLLRDALPYDAEDLANTGTYLAPGPGSAESLIDTFVNVQTDFATDEPVFVPVRSIVRFDELSTLIGQSDRTGNPMKPRLMELYDSYGPVEHRTRGHGLVRAHDHFASCITTTQVMSIKTLLKRSDVDSGFLNRWIFVGGPKKQLRAYGGEQLEVDKCVNPLQSIRARTQQRVMNNDNEMELKGDALQAWEHFFHTTIEPIKSDMINDYSLFVRSDLHLKKIILLLAANRGEHDPSLQTVQDALSLWPFIRRTYEIVSGNINVDEMNEITKDVLRAIPDWKEQYGRPPSAANLMRVFTRRGKDYTYYEVSRAIKTLISLQIVEEEVHEPKKGPSTIVFNTTKEHDESE